MVLIPFLALSLISPALASVGPTADLTLVNALVSPDGFERSAVLMNGIVPGPVIVGNKGDQLNLNVVNSLTDPTMLLSSSIHWHGFFQKNSSWADGPAFVTQCPIAANDSFLYSFSTTDQAGTNFLVRASAYYRNAELIYFIRYHSHLSTQYCDGLRGAIVIYDPEDPHATLYDVDNEDTVITLADWYHGPASTLGAIPTLVSTLINGLGRYAGGPTSQLAVVSVTAGQRYRFRLVSISCDPNFIFSIDGHSMTIIEVDGVNHQALTVDSIQIYAGQRYSFVLTANQPVSNYWIRSVANGGTAGFDNGINSAILRYVGASAVDPATERRTCTRSSRPPVPGTAVSGGADVTLNLAIALDFTTFTFTINGAEYTSPTAPVLLQILSGAHTAAELLPQGSVYTLPSNSVIEVSIPGGTPGAPHPFHLHGHTFHVIKSAGSDTFNFDDPVIRDVVSTGAATTDNTTIRFVTDNAGPHIDFHLEIGLAIVFAEDTETVSNSVQPAAWDTLCPTYNALTPAQLGGIN
ncbi:laccase [Mycena vulgaris]|nr:laccase [Mycena vulgaris]